MNRIGVRSELGVKYIEKVKNSGFLSFEGVFTHLAAAEEPEETKKQIDRWNSVIENIDTKGLLIHIQNTAATFAYAHSGFFDKKNAPRSCRRFGYVFFRRLRIYGAYRGVGIFNPHFHRLCGGFPQAHRKIATNLFFGRLGFYHQGI